MHRLSRTPVQAEGDAKRYNEAFAKAHTAFHAAVVGACSSAWRLRLRQLLFAQHERYRWLSRPLAKVERDLGQEHSAIAHAALERDAETAVALMTEHLQRTARIILDAVASAAATDEPNIDSDRGFSPGTMQNANVG